MKTLTTMSAVAVALMLAGCGDKAPEVGMLGGGAGLVGSRSGGVSPTALGDGSEGGGTGPVERVGEGGGVSPTAPGDGSEGGGTGPVERVGEGEGTSPTAPGDGSEGGGTGPVARVNDGDGREYDFKMIRHANDGPDGTSDGAHARGLEERQLSGGWGHWPPSISPNALYHRNTFEGSMYRDPLRDGAIALDTRDKLDSPRRTVRPTASWAGGAAPTLGLTVSGTGDDSFSVDRESSIPDLGTGWNGVALSKTVPTGRTAHAVVYSNIEKASGGTPDGHYLTLGAWLLLPDAPAAAVTQYDMGVFADGHHAAILDARGIGGTSSIDLDAKGRATYRGPATGLYTAATYSREDGSSFDIDTIGLSSPVPPRRLDTIKVGSFTATATINVDFSEHIDTFNYDLSYVPHVIDYLTWGVTGTVTNFRENGESLGNWTVDLEYANSPHAALSSNPPLMRRGDASGHTGDYRLPRGQWAVQFYRNPAADNEAAYAVGVFTASTSPAFPYALRIAGAFGAESQ